VGRRLTRPGGTVGRSRSTVVATCPSNVVTPFLEIGNPDTPTRLGPRLCWCARMAADSVHRSSERSVGVMCRMSAAEREELKHLAHAADAAFRPTSSVRCSGEQELRISRADGRSEVDDHRAPSVCRHPETFDSQKLRAATRRRSFSTRAWFVPAPFTALPLASSRTTEGGVVLGTAVGSSGWLLDAAS
jgi:hypothetical protein